MLDTSQLFKVEFIRDVSPSPDGSHIAYCVSHIAGGEKFQIWLLDLQSGDVRLLPYDGNASAPSWSPDGASIAFVGDGRLRIADFPSLTVSAPLTPVEMIAEGQCSWNPRTKQLAVLLREQERQAGAQVIRARVYRADGIGNLRGFSRRVYVVNPHLSECFCVTTGEVNCSQPSWSPDGREILFLAGALDDPFSLHARLLKSVVMRKRAVRTILAPPWYLEAAAWLPDGQRIVVVGAYESQVTIPAAELWTVKCDGSAPSPRTPRMKGNVGLRLQHDMPGRELTGRTRIVALEDDSVLVTVQVGGRGEIWRIALTGEVRHEVVVAGDRACILLAGSGALGSVLFAATCFDTPPDLWSLSLTSGEERQLTRIGSSAIADWPPFEMRPFDFTIGDGTFVDGWLVAAVGAQGPLPTILSIHAGPFLAAGHIFRFDFLMLAAQGYGVAFANFRGSAGYGEDFAAAIMNDWGRNGFPDHMATVDAIVGRGWADPERLGVWGTSHGGFATCWIVTHTDRFKAGLAEAATTDFSILYYLTDIPDVFERDLGGRPDQIPDIYRDRSPLTYADRCTTPVMLFHALDDERCPVGGALAFHRALQDAGCESELLLVESGAHTCDSTGPLAARRAQNEALVDWFGRHL